MTSVNPIRIGANAENASPTSSDLWLPVFGGEVLTRFEENNLLLGLVNTKTIPSGTTMKFPRLWKMESERHAAGTEMLGLPIEEGEISISIDDRPIVSHRWFDDIDQMLTHFEIRSDIANEMGRAIARDVDKNVGRLLVKASRTADPANGPFPGGGNDEAGTAYIDSALAADTVPSSSTSRAAAGALIKALDSATLKFEDRDAPLEDRVCVVKPKLWYALRAFGVPISAAEMYGAGATAGPFWQQPGLGNQQPLQSLGPRSETLEYNGIKIYRSPNVPSTNVTTGESKYQGNFTTTEGIVFQKQALAYLQLMGMKVATERSERHMADFMVVAHLGGGGALRPNLAIELATA